MFLKKNIFCQNWLHNSGSGSILGQNSGSGPKFDVFGSTTMKFTSLTNSLRYDDDLRPLSRLAVMSVVLQTSSGWRWRTLWWAAWAGAAVGAGEPPGSPTTATASMAPATATGIPTGMLLVICNFFFYIVVRIIRYLCTSIVLIRSLNQCFRLGSGQSPDPTNKNIKQKVCCGNCVTFFKDWHIFLLALVQLQANNTYQWIRIRVLKSRSWSLVSTTQIGQIKLTVSQDLFFKIAWLYFVVLHFEHSLRSGVLEPFIFGRVRL